MSHRSRAETDGYKNPPQNIPAAAIKCKLSLMIEDIVAKKMVLCYNIEKEISITSNEIQF